MYTIHPILDGTFDLPKSGMTYLVDEGFTMRTPVILFLLMPDDPSDPDTPVVVVDAGAEDGLVAGRQIDTGGPGPIREGLAAQGLAPSDVDTLVLTHLHHDHAANFDLFPDADIVVQQRELDATEDPLPFMRRTYIDEHVAGVRNSDPTIVDGDAAVGAGIELLHTPGHTRGHQSLIVETEEGPYAVAGDLVYCRQNLNTDITELRDGDGETYEVTPVDWEYIPPGLHIDVDDCYAGIARLQDRVPDDRILGGHLPEVLDHDQYPTT